MVINLTILEAEHIREALTEVREYLTLDAPVDHMIDGLLDGIDSSDEILRAVLSRDKASAYKLETLDDAEDEYLSAFTQEYPNIEPDTDS